MTQPSIAPPDPEAEWWTTTDIARYLGLQVGTIASYRMRKQMPQPDQTVGRTHMWKPARITAWRPNVSDEQASTSTIGR